ncbi:MAG TPA: hypothetical protein VGM90_16220 [Kofleriaceae bacterium]|jgi:hypothetical protein
MGWFSSDLPGHEGYIIGYTMRDGVDEDSHLYRELQYPGDDGDRRVLRIAAGCECGWRSARWRPEHGTEWMPHVVIETERDEAFARQLWRRHVQSDVQSSDALMTELTRRQ